MPMAGDLVSSVSKPNSTGAGVLCEIVNKDGSMARKVELQKFAKDHNLSIITIADLVRYRIHHEQITEDQD